MGTILIYSIGGAVLGAIAAGALFVLGFVFEIGNEICNCLTCDFSGGMLFDWSGMWGLFFVFVVGGGIIGLFYGISKAKEESDEELAAQNAENSEKAREQRKTWAGTIKQKALGVDNICSHNARTDQSVVFTEYKADTQMEEIVNELSKVAELEGLVDSLIEELS